MTVEIIFTLSKTVNFVKISPLALFAIQQPTRGQPCLIKLPVTNVFCSKLWRGGRQNDMGIDSGVLGQHGLLRLRTWWDWVCKWVSWLVSGGNLYRGAALQKQGLVGRVTGDQMGMLTTVMNGLAMRDAWSAVISNAVWCQPYDWRSDWKL